MELQCKRGDTIQILGTRVDLSGTPVSLVDTTVVSEMTKNDARKAWTVEITSAGSGEFQMTLSAVESATLSVGDWLCDIEFRGTDGSIISTRTFTVSVLEDITNAAG